MTRILMIVYGITAEQAASRLPAAQFAVTSVIAALFVWKLVPETKGKTLEDMTKLWKYRKG